MMKVVAAAICALSLTGTVQSSAVADNVNAEGAVPVSFVSGGNRIAGNLYMPDRCSDGTPCPGIVVSHPWGGVKEQTAGLYARELARRGFVTLAYDAENYAESEGQPRNFEDPAKRVENIRSAVGFLASRPGVRADAIGTLGICAGGGYTLHEAQTDLRVKAVAAVAAYDIGGAAREGITGSEVSPEGREAALRGLAEELNAVAAGAQPKTGDLLPSPEYWTAQTDAFTREAYFYYRTARGAHPNAANRFFLSSFILHHAYYPLEHMDLIAPRPVLLISGEKAETLKFSEEAFRRAKTPKALKIIPGATHFALYDQPEAFGPALAELTVFFKKHLNAK